MRLLFGNVIVVACNSALQLERLRRRNPDLTLEQCQQRIASQIPIEEKIRKAHVVLRNDGSLKSLQNQVRQVKILLAEIVRKTSLLKKSLCWNSVHTCHTKNQIYLNVVRQFFLPAPSSEKIMTLPNFERMER